MSKSKQTRVSGNGHIAVRGAREHNLRNLSVEIPRGSFVVITGVSGSGKSTLAFDILFAEGQRRFLDSMGTYARQFVERMARPDVDVIEGIPPTVSIEQRNSRGGGKSTVATVTEIYHFLRLLFARLGVQYCPECQAAVKEQTRDEVGGRLRLEMKRRGDLLLLAPMVRGRKGFHSEVAGWAAKHGYEEVRADGKIYRTDQPFRLDRFREHDVEIVTGVLEPGSGASRRMTARELVDATLRLGRGTLMALDNRRDLTVHSTERTCLSCGRSFPPLDPKFFSYNSPAGWCPTCRGFGEKFYLPEDVDRGARADAIEESWFGWQEGRRETCPDCDGSRLNADARAVRLVVGDRKGGGRRGGGDAPKLPGLTIEDLAAVTVTEALRWSGSLRLEGRDAAIARDIVPEVIERLRFLEVVGLGYLQLGRSVPTLSGGEAQRIRLAAQLGSNLSGVLYVLDEPTIGLHARDNERLLSALEQLKARGNSIIVVEHDVATMQRADFIVDLGPGAGVNGGEVVATGRLEDLMRHENSITGRCLRAKRVYPSRGERRSVSQFAVGPKRPRSGSQAATANKRVPRVKVDPAPPTLHLVEATRHNLNGLSVRFPLGRFVAITGVSGSGKSTLVRECLLPALAARLERKSRKAAVTPLPTGVIEQGYESIRAVHEVDQSPIGRTPRSTPATYVGFFDAVRKLFAQTPEARLRGYGPGRFSFNSSEGRCPECQGAGNVKLEMNFLPPAFVPCETCRGVRFKPETLDIEFNGKNIARILDMSVAEAREFFSAQPRIHRALDALHDTGLDYLRLGQPSPTLSGGEAQRVKLVSHLLTGLKEAAPLVDRAEKRNLFVLEEPTIGLHNADVQRLVDVLQRLVDSGHSVLVIEHNLELIAEADWVIDLGPEGGARGGRVVVEGTPERVARSRRSHTGRFLAEVLNPD